MIKYFCDRCDQDCSNEYKDKRISYVTLKKLKPYYQDDEHDESQKMLCKECTLLLEKFLKNS